MKRFSLIAATLLCSLAFVANAQMTDDQVIEYVKSAAASGKSQEQISRELVLRGVTQAQAERIKARAQALQVGDKTGSFGDDDAFGRDSGAPSVGRAQQGATYEQQYFNDQRSAQARRRARRNVKVDANRDRNQFDLQKEELDKLYKRTPDLTDMLGSLAPDQEEEIPDSLQIFGHDMFDGSALTFEPNENLATPENYVLGPGDQLLIEIFGYSEGSYSKTITPEGTINISQIGQVQLAGLSIREAKDKLRRLLVSKYSSVGGSNPNSTVSISLRNIRTIQVNVMGEVVMPGTFRLSSFATVFNALYNAGGVTENGSLRAIKVVRGGKQIATVDVYGYLFNGHSDSDIALREGDVIIVPPYVHLVQASGQVKRPMFYELAEGETLSDLIQYAGGFASKAYQEDFRVIRQQGVERQIFTVRKDAASSFAMLDGDEVRVGETMERFANKVEIRGAVFRPGMYELGGDIATVRQLVRAAGGLTEDAFAGRAVIVREKEDLTFESISFELGGVVSGAADDIVLRKNDILTVSNQKEIVDPGYLIINGYVKQQGVFPFSENTTVEDLILLAGGLMDGASTARVDVARRVSDPNSLTAGDRIGETFTFPLQDGLAVGEGEHFVLQPYDVVSVRKSPSFHVQEFVRIEGEVAFPGNYVLLEEGERLSDLIKRAGGPTAQAYLRGGTLRREMTEEEEAQQTTKMSLLRSVSGRDTLNAATIRLDKIYPVSIELDKAVKRPGSEYDPVLRAGDRIFVPGQQNTVRVSGAVLYPNTVIYVPGKSYRYYIDAAGGFSNNARRSKAFIIYMNGMSRPARGGSFDYNSKIEPGCEIVVPERGARVGMSTAEMMAMASSATSLTTMVATLVNLFK